MKHLLLLIMISLFFTACEKDPFNACIDNVFNYSEEKTSYFACLDLDEKNCYFVEEDKEDFNPPGFDSSQFFSTYIGRVYDNDGNFIDETIELESDSFNVDNGSDNFVLLKSKCLNIKRDYFLERTSE